MPKFLKLITLCFAVVYFVFGSTSVLAHPGNTAADGCHYCYTNCSYWGVPYGVRHCHGGYSSYTPPPACYLPGSTSGIEFTLSENNKNCSNTNVKVSWYDTYDSNKYAIQLSQNKTASVSPNLQKTNAVHTFNNVKPGTYYFKVKPINSCGWGKQTQKQIVVPTRPPVISANPTIDFEKEAYKITFSAECAAYFKVNIDGAKAKKYKNGDSVMLRPDSEDYAVRLTAVKGDVRSQRTLKFNKSTLNTALLTANPNPPANSSSVSAEADFTAPVDYRSPTNDTASPESAVISNPVSDLWSLFVYISGGMGIFWYIRNYEKVPGMISRLFQRLS